MEALSSRSRSLAIPLRRDSMPTLLSAGTEPSNSSARVSTTAARCGGTRRLGGRSARSRPAGVWLPGCTPSIAPARTRVASTRFGPATDSCVLLLISGTASGRRRRSGRSSPRLGFARTVSSQRAAGCRSARSERFRYLRSLHRMRRLKSRVRRDVSQARQAASSIAVAEVLTSVLGKLDALQRAI